MPSASRRSRSATGSRTSATSNDAPQCSQPSCCVFGLNLRSPPHDSHGYVLVDSVECSTGRIAATGGGASAPGGGAGSGGEGSGGGTGGLATACSGGAPGSGGGADVSSLITELPS